MLAKLRERLGALTHSLNVVQKPLLDRARRRTKADHKRAKRAERQADRLLAEAAQARREANRYLAFGKNLDQARGEDLLRKAVRKERKAARKDASAKVFHRRAHGWADRVRVLETRIAAIASRIETTEKQVASVPKNKAAEEVKDLVGVHEEPSGSNWGPMVSKFITFTGYSGPVFWCGCFACWVVCKIKGAKIPARIRLGYAPYITADALAGQNGLKAVPVSEAKRWDLGCLWGGQHIVVVRGAPRNGMVPTWEGNSTAPGETGSQSNGGEVTENERPISDFDAGIVARPAY